jgi:hypothetical protein
MGKIINWWARRKANKIKATLPHEYDYMPEKFFVLATYNAEVARGIKHQPEYIEKMFDLQNEFHKWHDEKLKHQGFKYDPVSKVWVKYDR